MTALLIVIVVVVGVVIILGLVASRRSASSGGHDRDERRHETIAHNPTLLDMPDSSRSGMIAVAGGFNDESVKEIMADVAFDAVDHPDGESSDDLDLLARPTHGDEPPTA